MSEGTSQLWKLIRFYEKQYGYTQAEAIASLIANLRDIKAGKEL